jgi:hypothetical protein
MIDGKVFRKHSLLVALGLDSNGRKHVLGQRSPRKLPNIGERPARLEVQQRAGYPHSGGAFLYLGTGAGVQYM